MKREEGLVGLCRAAPHLECRNCRHDSSGDEMTGVYGADVIAARGLSSVSPLTVSSDGFGRASI
jgi:hypothetical protein